MRQARDVAVVLSGGGINGVLMELGFLQRVRDSPFWPRIGWIFGASAGALAGMLAAAGRLDDLERFLVALQPEDIFKRHSLWRLPLVGSHAYALPLTIEQRLGDRVELARDVAASDVELVVIATDLTDDYDEEDGASLRELVYSSRTTPPEVFAEAVIASAAVSALVLPVRVGDRIATDGGWARNFPLAYAYELPDVETIISFRYLPRYPRIGIGSLVGLRRRLQPFGRVPPVRGLTAELRRAEDRAARGEPAHLLDMIVRVMTLAVLRNNALEERLASENDQAIRELETLREDIVRLLRDNVRGSARRERVTREVFRRFESARFPFRHDRLVPRITVDASSGNLGLDPGFFGRKPWTDDAKRALIARGYELADRALADREQAVA